MFTDRLAHVGRSEREAQRMDLAVRVARLPMDAVLRTHTRGQTFGFMKVLVSGSDESIVGFTMVGSEAAEVMAAVQTTMLAKVPYATLRDAGIARLTMTEELEPLANVPPR
jgi:pyruvate/2-oxoglutarate dehydrogenase complex dihydrolipoamide dehydrogenase (E3) component